MKGDRLVTSTSQSTHFPSSDGSPYGERSVGHGMRDVDPHLISEPIVEKVRRSGFSAESLPDALGRLARLRHQLYSDAPVVQAFLADTGLTYPELLDACLGVWFGVVPGGEIQKRVGKLQAYGMPAEVVAAVLDQPLPVVQACLDSARYSDHTADILRLHHEGFTPVEIADELDLPSRNTVYRVLHRMGLKPHRRLRRRRCG